MLNLPGLFYSGQGSLGWIDYVGICKAEHHSICELNMEPNLVRLIFGNYEYPSTFDKELLIKWEIKEC